jgi:hypothetical protein
MEALKELELSEADLRGMRVALLSGVVLNWDSIKDPATTNRIDAVRRVLDIDCESNYLIHSINAFPGTN